MDEIRSVLRGLYRFPATPASVMLVLGIGMTMAIVSFAILDAVVLNPMHLPGAGRIVSLAGAGEPPDHDRLQWWGQAPAFSKLALYASGGANFGSGTPRRITLTSVTGDFFDVFGVSPTTGTGFSNAAAEGEHRVVLSYKFWKANYPQRDGVGKSIYINRIPATIAGVMPASFVFPGETDAWILDRQRTLLPELGDDRKFGVSLREDFVARLGDSYSTLEAQSQIRALQERLRQMYEPKSNWRSGMPIVVHTLAERLGGRVRPQLIAAFSLSCLFLLVACSNAGGLMMARMLSRRKAIAIRMAMGASSWQVFTSLLAECALLSIGAGVVGIVLTSGILIWIRNALATTEPLLGRVGVNFGLLGLIALLIFCSTILLAGLCSVELARSGLFDSIKEGGQISGGSVQYRFRTGLALIQYATTFILVVAQVVTVQQIIRLSDIKPGFDAAGALTATLSLLPDAYKQPADIARFQHDLLSNIAAAPDKMQAAIISKLPLSEKGGKYLYLDVAGRAVMANTNEFSGDYFHVLHIPVLQWIHPEPDEKFVVINSYLASLVAPGKSALGRYMTLEGEDAPRRITGVVGNIKSQTLSDESEAQIYLPYAYPYRSQYADRTMTVVLRGSSGNMDSQLVALRAILKRVDSSTPIFDVENGAELTRASMSSNRLRTRAASLTSILAIVIGGFGLYSLLAYFVVSRTSEIGIRRAFGAPTSCVVALVAREGILIGLGGTLFGAGVSLAASRIFESVFTGFGPVNSLALVTAGGIILLVAGCGSILPIWRALRIDPAHALRY